jgi:integrase
LQRARHKQGSVVLDRRRKTWYFLFCDENGIRRTRTIGTLRDYPTKTAAWRQAEAFRQTSPQPQSHGVSTVSSLIEQYRIEKMPQRHSTRLGYEAWINNHILPRWGSLPITELQARPIELWLQQLDISPKSRVHIRGLISMLWDFAMWRGDIPTQRNPMELVTIKGASKRTRQPRSLTVEGFQSFLAHLEEPFRTLALVCLCFDLRISIGKLGTHTMRHTYRSWLDAVGTPVAVQQKLMRHADIRTTMNVYGDVVTHEMQQAHGKVVGMALRSA